jgi:hypothetical protein
MLKTAYFVQAYRNCERNLRLSLFTYCENESLLIVIVLEHVGKGHPLRFYWRCTKSAARLLERYFPSTSGFRCSC